MRREGPSANDDYNVRRFGVTNEQFRVLRRLENNIGGGSGYYMTLDEINKYLDGATVGFSRASQSDIDAVAKAFTRKLRSNSRRRTSLRRNSNYIPPILEGMTLTIAGKPRTVIGVARGTDWDLYSFSDGTSFRNTKRNSGIGDDRVGGDFYRDGKPSGRHLSPESVKKILQGVRANSRRRTSLRRNRGDYRSGMLTDRDYMSLGDRITRSVLSTAGYKPHNNFEEDQKHWRQARIDALTALMIEGMLDGPRAGVEEREAAMDIAVDVARRNR